MIKVFALAIAVLALSAPAVAQSEDDWQSWPLADRFTISLDAFSPYLDTRVRIDASDESPGTTIDFEQNLGLSDTETLPGLGLSWRFAKKHQLSLDYFKLDRSGSSITGTIIRIGDEVFDVDLPISFFFDMEITSFNYSYSLLLDERKELALSVGLSIQDLQFGFIGNAGLGLIEIDSPTNGLARSALDSLRLICHWTARIN
jgi:hypothetical protein